LRPLKRCGGGPITANVLSPTDLLRERNLRPARRDPTLRSAPHE
jgi:hypothetical protein